MDRFGPKDLFGPSAAPFQATACLRSVYSWDLVITKLSNKLVIDKRDGSQIDFLSVNEIRSDLLLLGKPVCLRADMKLRQDSDANRDAC